MQAAPTFLAQLAASVIDENSPHHACSNRKEVRLALPIDLTLPQHPDVGFVDQCRGLKGVPW